LACYLPITYLGMSAVIKIEATGTRLFLVVVIFGVAFSAASLLAHSLGDRAPTGTPPYGEPSEVWPRWYSQFSQPMVYCRSDHVPYVVLPRPSQRTAGGLPVDVNLQADCRST
jgi:hypothetical protein